MEHPQQHRSRRVLPFVFPSLLLIAVGALGSAGGGGGLQPGAVVSDVLRRLVFGGWAPMLYLLSAVGIGGLFRPWLRGARDGIGLQATLGLATMFTMTHLLGQTGVLFTGVGRTIVWALALWGIIVALGGLRRWWRARAWERLPRGLFHESLLLIPAIAVLLLAASTTPGWLWGSEYGGYDALSYHLQLPQEWLARGRLEPLEHNVYSYLPGYMEAAFAHLAVLMGAPVTAGQERRAGLLTGDGLGALSPQYLHAFLTFAAAWLTSRAARAASHHAGLSQPSARLAAAVAGGLVVVTPWSVVVGSLAYNEMALLALFAGAALAATETRLRPLRRGLVIGSLVGVACGAKPTALLFAGIPAGLLMLALAPRREWARLVLAACGAGLLTLLPWLVRNAVAGGNPVFPAMTGLFGSAHWTAEQVRRFASSHIDASPLPVKLGLLLSVSRGLFHPQWFAFFVLTPLAATAGLILRPSRRLSLFLVLGLLAQAVVWLFTTHLQARFLLPMLVPGAILTGLAAGSLRQAAGVRTDARAAVSLAVVVAILLQSAATLRLYATQRDGAPAAWLGIDPAVLAGGASDLPPDDHAALREIPQVYVRALPPGGRLLLLGGATPFYYPPGTLYNTTWDPWWPAEGDGDWTANLRAHGIEYVLADLSEIERLNASGYAHPGITTGAVRTWIGKGSADRSLTIVRPWEGSGLVLLRLR